ncbi:hypothetical protein E4N85_11880 [Treponema denticola]|uniref:hypothetical protein n=1 Tax=Treponema denticola TaxID=158 RepID=UPI0020A3E0C5|nr:hypothetical protein [Treponema denticola]UTC96392.1 hypothetical protein E4N85_11880 [Treponema denticola]
MSTKNIQCKKRKIVVWIISIDIIAALFFGISKFISYRTMPPFAAEAGRAHSALLSTALSRITMTEY